MSLGKGRCAPRLTLLAAVTMAAMTLAPIVDAAPAGPDHGPGLARRPVAARPPVVRVTVNPAGTVTRYGTAILSGQLYCGNARHVRVSMTLHQTVGGERLVAHRRLVIRGGCHRTWRPWVTAVGSRIGRFTDGAARWRAHATSYGKGHAHTRSSAKVWLMATWRTR